MRYLTARKRAEGKGPSHTGTEHHWYMTVSSVGLALMIPTFVVYMGRALGRGHEEVLATFQRPFPALLFGIVIFVSLNHFRKGSIMMIEDYAQGSTRKFLIIFMTCFTYLLTATALYALAKMAL